MIWFILRPLWIDFHPPYCSENHMTRTLGFGDRFHLHILRTVFHTNSLYGNFRTISFRINCAVGYSIRSFDLLDHTTSVQHS